MDGLIEAIHSQFRSAPPVGRRPTRDDADRLVAECASLQLGGWTVPELARAVGAQVRLVWALAQAYDEDDRLTSDGAVELVTGSTVSGLADRIRRHRRGSLVGRSVPTLDPLVATTWCRATAFAVGRRARDGFVYGARPRPTKPAHGDPEIVAAQQMVVLSNLTKLGRPDRESLERILGGSGLPDEVRGVLLEAFRQPHQHPVDFDVFGEDDRLPLMMDLVALAGRPSAVDPTERRYVERVAVRLGFPFDDLAPLVG